MVATLNRYIDRIVFITIVPMIPMIIIFLISADFSNYSLRSAFGYLSISTIGLASYKVFNDKMITNSQINYILNIWILVGLIQFL